LLYSKVSAWSPIMDLESSGAVLVRSPRVFYLDPKVMEQHQDVFLISESGDQFGFNRCILAAASTVCWKMFSDLYLCPIANSDQCIFVSTNFSVDELTTVHDFFTEGKMPDGDDQCQQLFSLFGLKLDLLSGNVISADNDSHQHVVKSDQIQPEHPSVAIIDESIDDDDDVMKNDDALLEDLVDEIRIESELTELDLDYDDQFEAYEEVIDDNKSGKRKSEIATENAIIPAKRRGNFKRKKANVDGDEPVKRYVSPEEARDLLFYFPQEGDRDMSLTFQCERCVRGFSYLAHYRQHYYRHDMPEPDYSQAFQCMRCLEYKCESKGEMLRHGKNECPVKQHDDKLSPVTYFCAFCEPGQSFQTLYLLNVHIKTEHEDKRTEMHSCVACGKFRRDPKIIYHHKLNEGPFHDSKCVYVTCNKTVGTWQEHQDHLNEAHGGVFKYKCGQCGINTFDTEKDMTIHRLLCKIVKAERRVKVFENGDTQCTACEVPVEPKVSSVKKHLKQFHPSVMQQCDQCNGKFISKHTLNVHIQISHMGEKYPCGNCDKVYSTKRLLDEHLERACGFAKKQFKCDVDDCGYELATRSGLWLHKKRKHETEPQPPPKLKICDICGKDVEEGRKYTYHMEIYHSTKTYKCDECDKVCNHPKVLYKHKRAQHQFITCDICGVTLNTVAYKRHMVAQHTDEKQKPYYCNTCDKGFVTKPIYQDHMNIHTGETPHKCDFCDKRYKSNGTRINHMKLNHSDLYSKNYPGKTFKDRNEEVTCEFCGISVKSKALRRHKMSKHTAQDQKPFYCQPCDKGFVTKALFSDHMNIHTGERPHTCYFCERTFKSHANRHLHMKDAHNELYEEKKKKKKASK